jgi:transcriptional regulator with XRE-family HTH domain
VKDLRSAFGARIRELRNGAELSQEELAARAGVHWTYLSDLERGRQSATLDIVNRLARALEISIADLFAPLDEPYRARYRKRRIDSVR